MITQLAAVLECSKAPSNAVFNKTPSILLFRAPLTGRIAILVMTLPILFRASWSERGVAEGAGVVGAAVVVRMRTDMSKLLTM